MVGALPLSMASALLAPPQKRHGRNRRNARAGGDLQASRVSFITQEGNAVSSHNGSSFT